MNIQECDLQKLQQGEPPVNDDILRQITCGRELWLDIINNLFLEKFIKSGGSKVKFIYGDMGAGKTHALREIAISAKEIGYETMFFDLAENLSNNPVKLSNVVSFYKMIAEKTDILKIIKLLSYKIANIKGYDKEDFSNSNSFLAFLVEKEGLPVGTAEKEIRTSILNAFKDVDISASFKHFIFATVYAEMTGKNINNLFIRWLRGDKLLASEKKEINIYETLKNVTAINWLYSLIKLISISGLPGLLVIFDNLQTLQKKDSCNHYYYTPKAVNDFFEFIREIIDKTEILENFFMILSTEKEMLDDEKRGLKSYEALWMRIQSGIISHEFFNPYHDLVNMNKLFENLEKDNLIEEVAKKLDDLFRQNGMSPRYKDIPIPQETHPLKRRVMEKSIIFSME